MTNLAICSKKWLKRMAQRKHTTSFYYSIGFSGLSLALLLASLLPHLQGWQQWLLITVSIALLGSATISFIVARKQQFRTVYLAAVAETLLSFDKLPIALLDSHGEIVTTNAAARQLLGNPNEEEIGTYITDFTDEHSRPILIDAVKKSLAGESVEAIIQMEHSSGFPLEIQGYFRPIILGKSVVGVNMIACDTRAHKRNAERIRYMAYYDDVTGLPNRTSFYRRLEEMLPIAAQEKRLLGIGFMDLDSFKLINASFGRESGDMLLMQVAERMSHLVDEGDYIARMEGDQFGIIYEQIESEDALLARLRTMLHRISEPYVISSIPLHVTASVGGVTSRHAPSKSSSLLAMADIALIKTKETSNSECLLYSPCWENEAVGRLALQHELYRAVQQKEFVLYYQPQYDLATGKVAGMEALIRWQHPDRGLLLPGSFIPLAEESGIIVQIGDWVLEEACRQNKAWQRAGLPAVPVSVNMSIRQFVQKDLVQKVTDVLARTQLDAKYLDLEITESMSLDAKHVSNYMTILTSMGVGISIDDFGTGYSSFNYLKNYPIDRLKIDRSFVRDIEHSQGDAGIVAAIISMAHNLNIQVVAEGVETASQMEFLRKHRCDEMQGYYWSPPVTGSSMRELLAN